MQAVFSLGPSIVKFSPNPPGPISGLLNSACHTG